MFGATPPPGLSKHIDARTPSSSARSILFFSSRRRHTRLLCDWSSDVCSSDLMLQHARELAGLGIPFMFDPGQGLPMFSGEELLAFVEQASYVAVNDYEGRMLEERTGRKLEEMAQELKALVLTRGAEGSIIYADVGRIEIPCVRAAEVVDPTGCGDAYRAGLLYGLAAGFDWPKTGRLAALMGSIKIASRGGQNHSMSLDEIKRLFRRNFGSDI